MSVNSQLKKMLLSATNAVDPISIVKRVVKVEESHLHVLDRSFELKKPCFLVGFGKAVLGMAIELENILGSQLDKGIVNVPVGIFKTLEGKSDMLPSLKSKVRFIEGAQNNMPDENSLKGARAITSLVKELEEEDLLIVLISGGGSALLPFPKPPITLQEKQEVIKKLAQRGADIIELNSVRKKLSVVKGGGLAKIAHPAKVVSLILSDIVGDSLDSIASGPTTPDWNSSNTAWDIISKYSLSDEIPDSVKHVLNSGEDSRFDSSFYNDENQFKHVENIIIGNNRTAAEKALEQAKSMGYESSIISTKIEGKVESLSQNYAILAKYVFYLMNDDCYCENSIRIKEEFKEHLKAMEIDESDIENILSLNFKSIRNGICLIGAGEPTVVVKCEEGKGGRNQELALRFALEVNKFNLKSAQISFLSCGTDGIDGPTDAAGAIVTNHLISEAYRQKIDPYHYLKRSDSYNFFSKYNNGKNFIKIGHTGTNVMDIHIIIVRFN